MAAQTIEQKRALAIARAKLKLSETTPVFAETAPVEPESEGSSILDTLGNAATTVADVFTGNERAKGAFEDAPEFKPGSFNTQLETTTISQDAKMAAGLLVSADPQQKMDIIKAHIPGAKFLQRKDGSVIVKVEGKDYWLDRPGVSTGGLVEGLGQMLSFLPALKLSSMVKGPIMRTLAGGGGAAATSASLDLASGAAGSEQGVDPLRAALTGGFGALGEAVPLGYNAFRASRQAKGYGVPTVDYPKTPMQVEAAEKLQTQVKDVFGVDFPLFQAQKTQSGTAGLTQEKLLLNTLGASVASEALEKQNKAAHEVVTQFIDQLIPLSLNANLRVQAAAGKSIDLLKAARKQKSSPIYTAALNNPSGVAVNTRATLDVLESAKVGVPKEGKVYKTLTKVNGLLHNRVKGETSKVPPSSIAGLRRGGPHPVAAPKTAADKLIPATDPRLLHNAKVEIDALLAGKGDLALDNHVAAKLIEVQMALVKDLKSQVPGYEKAAAEYAKSTIPLDALYNSQIKTLSNIPVETADRVRAAVFAPSVSRETQIHTRDIIKGVDPEAWQMLLRQEALDKVSKASTSLAEGSTNASMVLYRALKGPTDKTLNSFRNAMSPKEKSSYDIVLSILKQGEFGVPKTIKPTSGSGIPGSGDGGLTTRIYGRITSSPTDLGRVAGSPSKMLGIDDKTIIELAEAMFDPKWNPTLRKLRAMGPGSTKAYQGLMVLLSRIEDDRVNTEENSSEPAQVQEQQ